MPAKLTEKDGGMASGILRGSVRVILGALLVALVAGLILFLR